MLGAGNYRDVVLAGMLTYGARVKYTDDATLRILSVMFVVVFSEENVFRLIKRGKQKPS